MENDEIQKKATLGSGDLVCLLKKLVSIPSPPGYESEILNYTQNFMHSLGLATSWIYLEETGLEKHPAFIPWGARKGRNLLAVWGAPEAKPTRYPVLFNGHVDVVPPGETSDWKTPPYQAVERHGRIYGNGAADTKGGIACLLYVLKLLVRQGFEPKKPLAVELVVDEERLGNGTLANVLAGISAEQAIFLEPSGSDCIVGGHRGSIIFRITIRAEGSELNSRGTTSPIFSRLFKVFDALEQWKAKRRIQCANILGDSRADHAPLYFGKLSGGNWFSAPLVSIHIDGVCGYLPGERREDIVSAFLQHFKLLPDLAPLLKTGELIISLEQGFVEPCVADKNSSLITSLKRAVSTIRGFEPKVEYCENTGADVRLRRIYDQNCQCVFYGPGGNNCHQADENVSIDELVTVSQILIEWIITQCGTIG